MTSNNIEASGGDGSDGRNLSRNQRLQFIPRASFKRILEAALDGLQQIQDLHPLRQMHALRFKTRILQIQPPFRHWEP